MMSWESSQSHTLCCLVLLAVFAIQIVTTELVDSGAQETSCVIGEKSSSSCSSTLGEGGKTDVNEDSTFSAVDTKRSDNKAGEILEDDDSLLHRSMQGLEGMLDQMASSKDQMMKDFMEKMTESRMKMMEGFDSVMAKMSKSREKMMESFDSVMGKMSESHSNVMKRLDLVMHKMAASRTKMMDGLDSMMEKMSESKEKMREGLDTVLDQVSHSKMMEEIDQLLESVSHSKVMEEIRALPQEIRESFILSARNKSYLIAGVMVAITSFILFSGAMYYAWCHHDAWSYYIGTIEEAKALLRQAKESRFGRSRSSSEANGDADDATEQSHPQGEEKGEEEEEKLKNGDLPSSKNGHALPVSDSDPRPGVEDSIQPYIELVDGDHKSMLVESEQELLVGKESCKPESNGDVRVRNGKISEVSNGDINHGEAVGEGGARSHDDENEVFLSSDCKKDR